MKPRTYLQRDRKAIESWLVVHLASLLRIRPEDIDVQAPFAQYGLDSLTAVYLVGHLEEWLDRALPATLAWDFPNIEALSKYLAESEATVHSSPRSSD
jgi:acyl carrier protein